MAPTRRQRPRQRQWQQQPQRQLTESERLFPAILSQDVDRITELLNEGADVNVRSQSPMMRGKTPLHLALSWGHEDVVELLLRKGANATAKDEFGVTPFHTVAAVGLIDVARILLNHAGPSNNDNDNQHDGRLSMLQEQDNHGRTPLHQACARSQEALIVFLFRQLSAASISALVGVRTNKGLTALHCAVTNSNENIVRLLLDNMDVPLLLNAQDDEGCTAIHYAISFGHDWCLGLLLEAAVQSNVSVFYIQTNRGDTPLHCAAHHNHVSMARMLLKKEQDHNIRSTNNGDNDDDNDDDNADTNSINMQDKDGRTPLHTAIEFHGKTEMLQLLLRNGASLVVRQQDGNTVLHTAAISGVPQHVSTLLLHLQRESGIPDHDRQQIVNSTNNDGNTALHLVCSCDVVGAGGTYDIIEQLLRHGADLYDCTNEANRTVLQQVYSSGQRPRDIFLLLERHVGQRWKHYTDIVEALVGAGCFDRALG